MRELARKITPTLCPRDPKQNSLQLGRKQWEEDGSYGQRGYVHCVWPHPLRQRDIWRDLAFPLGGTRVRLLSIWWSHLHDCLGKPPVPYWTGLNRLRVSLSVQKTKH